MTTKPKTFFGKLLEIIGIRQLFVTKSDLKTKVRTIIEIVERLKKAVDSNEATIITMIIPGSWDNKAIEKLRVILTSVLLKLRLSQSNDTQVVTMQAVKKLAQMNKIDRNQNYKRIATKMLLLDSSMSEMVASDMVEKEYQEFKGQKV